MAKTAREILAEYGDTHRNRSYDFNNGDLTETEYKEYIFSDIDQALKELEAIMSRQVIGYTQYPDQSKDVTYDMYIKSTLQSKQRQALQTALYGEALTNGEIADKLFVDEED